MMIIRYKVQDTSQAAERARRNGYPDPRFDDLDEAIQFAVRDLDRWTDGSGHYVIHQVETTDQKIPGTSHKPNADGTYDVYWLDMVTIVGFVCCDRTRDYGDMVYLGVDGTVRRFKKDHEAENFAGSLTEVSA